MSRTMLSAEKLRQLAAQCHSWKEAAEKHEQIRILYLPKSPQFRELDRRVTLNDQGLSNG